jgi:hypothetical protein
VKSVLVQVRALLSAQAAIPMLHIQVEMIPVRSIRPGSKHRTKNAAGVLMRLYHEIGSLF